MEEFKALREEIVRLEKEILQITFYVFTVSIAIASLASNNSKYIEIIPILYQIALIWGLDKYVSSSRLKVRLSTYIQVFLEPKYNDLNWESKNSNFEIVNKFYSKKWRLIKKLTNLFSLLFLIGIYVSFSYFKTVVCLEIENVILVSLLLLLHIFGLYYLIIGIFNYPNSKEYVKKWNAAINETRK